MFLPRSKRRNFTDTNTNTHTHTQKKENLYDYIPDITKANVDRIIIWLFDLAISAEII